MLPIYKSKSSIFNYDEIPPGYYYQVMTSGSPVQRFWHVEKFQRVIHHLPTQGRFLDLGCGPGSFIQLFKQSNPHSEITGADIASTQIDFAKELHKNSKQVSFAELSLTETRLPFPDHSFDGVSCIEVIEHIHPFLAHQLLSEVRRVLKPAGTFVVTTPNYRSAWPFIEFALEKLSPVKYHEQHINKFTPNSFVKFLESAGYTVTHLETVFVFAPFLAKLNKTLANIVHQIELSLQLKVGSLLLGKCSPTVELEHD